MSAQGAPRGDTGTLGSDEENQTRNAGAKDEHHYQDSSNPDTRITIRLRTSEKDELQFLINSGTRLARMLVLAGLRYAFDWTTTVFRYEGREVKSSDTPYMLGVKDGDCIMAQVERTAPIKETVKKMVTRLHVSLVNQGHSPNAAAEMILLMLPAEGRRSSRGPSGHVSLPVAAESTDMPVVDAMLQRRVQIQGNKKTQPARGHREERQSQGELLSWALEFEMRPETDSEGSRMLEQARKSLIPCIAAGDFDDIIWVWSRGTRIIDIREGDLKIPLLIKKKQNLGEALGDRFRLTELAGFEWRIRGEKVSLTEDLSRFDIWHSDAADFSLDVEARSVAGISGPVSTLMDTEKAQEPDGGSEPIHKTEDGREEGAEEVEEAELPEEEAEEEVTLSDRDQVERFPDTDTEDEGSKALPPSARKRDHRDSHEPDNTKRKRPRNSWHGRSGHRRTLRKEEEDSDRQKISVRLG
jgi:hypothetical protein